MTEREQFLDEARKNANRLSMELRRMLGEAWVRILELQGELEALEAEKKEKGEPS